MEDFLIDYKENLNIMKIIFPLILLFACSFSHAQLPDKSKMVKTEKKCKPMNDTEFNELCVVMKGRASEQTKLNHAKSAIKKACLSSEQISNLIPYFQLDEHRLELAKFCKSNCSDPENLEDKILPLMKSEESKSELREFLSKK